MEKILKINQIYNSPIIEVIHKNFKKAGVRLLIKRDDLLHPKVSGNKWRKLKYNLIKAIQENKQHLVTFGGAYSNHIHATAAAAQLAGLTSSAFIRGERPLKLNPTLVDVQQMGMKLHFVSRTQYRDKPGLLKLFAKHSQSDHYVLPEGGTNQLAMKGSREIVTETIAQLSITPTHWCVACGTGGTIGGIIEAANSASQVIGFAALKGNFLEDEVNQLYINRNKQPTCNWSINNDYHFGGYTKFNERLIQFINNWKKEFSIPLDPIYTGKLFFGINDMILKGKFPKDSVIVAIHTGGLQGIRGFNQRFGDLII